MAAPDIPFVRPGSEASQAVDEVAEYFATHPNPTPTELESLVKDSIVAHGGDSVTAAASAATASELAGRSPGQEQAIAQQLVGVTLADPARNGQAVAQNTRRAWAEAASAGDGSVDKAGIAREQAMQTLAGAGAMDSASTAAFDAKFHEYLDQGVSPELAAAQAVAMVLAQGMPQADSFSIYGYLTMLVHGNTDYVFKNQELVHIEGSAIHSHFADTVYQMSSTDFLVDCDTIKTSSTGEDVRTHSGSAVGRYEGTYFSYARVSGSAYLYRHKWAGLTKTISVATYSGNMGRVYLAGLDSDLMMKKNKGAKVDDRKTPVEVCDAAKRKLRAAWHRIK